MDMKVEEIKDYELKLAATLEAFVKLEGAWSTNLSVVALRTELRDVRKRIEAMEAKSKLSRLHELASTLLINAEVCSLLEGGLKIWVGDSKTQHEVCLPESAPENSSIEPTSSETCNNFIKHAFTHTESLSESATPTGEPGIFQMGVHPDALVAFAKDWVFNRGWVVHNVLEGYSVDDYEAKLALMTEFGLLNIRPVDLKICLSDLNATVVLLFHNEAGQYLIQQFRPADKHNSQGVFEWDDSPHQLLTQIKDLLDTFPTATDDRGAPYGPTEIYLTNQEYLW